MADFVSAVNKASELTAKRSFLRLHLGPAFDSRLLNEIDEGLINRFVKRQLDLGLKPKTVNNQLILLRTILGCAFYNELISKIPKIRKLRVASEKVEFLDDDEKVRLVNATVSEPDWQAAVLVGLNCGQRLGELIALKWEDIDLVA